MSPRSPTTPLPKLTHVPRAPRVGWPAEYADDVARVTELVRSAEAAMQELRRLETGRSVAEAEARSAQAAAAAEGQEINLAEVMKIAGDVETKTQEAKIRIEAANLAAIALCARANGDEDWRARRIAAHAAAQKAITAAAAAFEAAVAELEPAAEAAEWHFQPRHPGFGPGAAGYPASRILEHATPAVRAAREYVAAQPPDPKERRRLEAAAVHEERERERQAAAQRDSAAQARARDRRRVTT